MQRVKVATEQRIPAIRTVLTDGAALTVAEISERTAIAPPAVRCALALMLFSGEIQEEIRLRAGSGHNPLAYRLSRERAASGRADPLVRTTSFRSDL